MATGSPGSGQEGAGSAPGFFASPALHEGPGVGRLGPEGRQSAARILETGQFLSLCLQAFAAFFFLNLSRVCSVGVPKPHVYIHTLKNDHIRTLKIL